MPADKQESVYGKGKKKVEAAERVGVFITVEGEYFSKTINYCVEKPYKIELQLHDNPNIQLPPNDRIRAIAHNRLLPNYFRNHADEYPDYSNVRTCKLIDIKTEGKGQAPVKSDTAIMDMSLNDLVLFTAKNDLRTNPLKYPTISDARRAVSDEMENRKLAEIDLAYQEQKDKAKKGQEFEDVKEILEFNNISV